MSGWYLALETQGRAVAEALEELGCREGFYKDGRDFAQSFSFAEGPEGWTSVGVKTEIGENLLTYAKLTGLVRVRRDRTREEKES